MDGGRTVLVKDGRLFELGMGGGLIEAVADDGRARSIAQRYRRNNIWATIVGLVAVTCSGAAVAAYFEYGSLEARATSTTAFLVCAPTFGIATLVHSRNRAYLYDAINAYNERH